MNTRATAFDRDQWCLRISGSASPNIAALTEAERGTAQNRAKARLHIANHKAIWTLMQ